MLEPVDSRCSHTVERRNDGDYLLNSSQTAAQLDGISVLFLSLAAEARFSLAFSYLPATAARAWRYIGQALARRR